jgi:hypothetical protein
MPRRGAVRDHEAPVVARQAKEPYASLTGDDYVPSVVVAVILATTCVVSTDRAT